MFSLFKWQKINFKTSQFNNFAFCRKSMTYDGHNVVKVFFATRPTNPIWVWVQRIPSFFMYYCKQKFYNHFCKAWGFMLPNQGNMPWWVDFTFAYLFIVKHSAKLYANDPFSSRTLKVALYCFRCLIKSVSSSVKIHINTWNLTQFVMISCNISIVHNFKQYLSAEDGL